jgi:uncharacterized membrane protein YfcA
MDLAFITAAAVLAGFIDAVVGGGGLILLPALLATYPQAPIVSMLGTNKSASVWGSGFSAWQYSRRVPFNWAVAMPGVAACLVGSGLGATLLLYVPSDALRQAVPFVLTCVLIYTLFNKQLGKEHAPRYKGRQETVLACLIGGIIGFYDGFFGPGTGSFFVFLFVRVLGYDFLSASAYAKLFNMATNLSAFGLLAYKGYVWWHLTLYLIAGNLVGSFFGAKMAMKHGAGFVRWIFIFVVTALIAKTGYDAFLKV